MAANLLPSLPAQVRAYCVKHDLLSPGTLVVGVSGGADSLTLLHVLITLSAEFGLRLHVATLDHGIRGAESASDVDYVCAVAEKWQLPVTVSTIDTPALAAKRTMGIEETARAVRYDFFRQTALTVGAERIAVAHNRDDQAETVLMHVLRGSGLTGLRGMLPITPLDTIDTITTNAPLLIRPLLNTPRTAIDAYAAAHDLKPRTDSTNADVHYLRNRLRHEVLPYLRQINPSLDEALAHTAEIARADYAALRDLLPTSESADRLKRTHFAALPLSIQRMAIRERTGGLRFDQVEALINWIGRSTSGQQHELPGGVTVRLTFTDIVFEKGTRHSVDTFTDNLPALDQTVPFTIPVTGRVMLSDGWFLEMRPVTPHEIINPVSDNPLRAVLIFPADSVLELRTWQRADRFYPQGLNGHSQKLSDTLINMKVPAIWRDRLPLLTINGQIAWFVAPTPTGLRARVAEVFAYHQNVPGATWELRYHRDEPVV